MRSKAAKLSIVAPCFNEQEGLQEFYNRTTDAAKGVMGEDYELVLVDDGSKDATWSIMSTLAQQDEHVVAVKLSRNFGHQLALTAGVAHSSGDYLFILDADLQDPPELLGDMLALMRSSGTDVVYGQRKVRNGESAFKRGSAHLFYRLMSRIAEIEIPVDTGDFRLITRKVAELLVAMPERDRFIRGMVSWVGFKQAAFFYDRDARYAGETKYPLRKMIKFSIDAILGFSMAPLRIAAYSAFALSLVLFLLFGYVLYSLLFLDTQPGWASSIIVILSVSVIQLICLSAIGEYVGRTYLQSKRRPLFIVDQVRAMERGGEQ